MKLEIVKILDRGKLNEERLWLKVLASTNLQFYIVFDTVYTAPNAITNLQRHAYWFAPGEVKAGDVVVLYTRKGNYTSKLNPNGTTTHFFYWGMDTTLWENLDGCAVLFEVGTWQTSKFRE